MKNKIVLLAALPILALATTSCNRSRNVSFKEALEFVSNNYDKHSLDYVKGNYTLKTSQLNMNMDGVFSSSIGSSYDFKIGFGLNDITARSTGLSVIPLDSSMLKIAQTYYTAVEKATLEKFTDIKLNKNYMLSNNCLTLKVGTDGSDVITGAIAMLLNVMNIDALREIMADNIPMVGSYISMADYYLFSKFAVTIDSSSEANGKFYVSASTDDCGYINNFTFDLEGHADLNLLLAGKKKYSEYTYNINLVGDFNIVFSLDLDFNN